MKTSNTIGLATISSPTEEPTAASMWHALAGSPLTNRTSTSSGTKLCC
jgi:hypothetical protein